MNILNNLKSLAVIAIATMAFTSCSKDQTSFSIDDIQGKAKIKGTLTYSEGTEYKNGESNKIIKAATNTTIWVKINNASLSPNGQTLEHTTYTTFETVTDAKGEYEIEVPVSESIYGTEIKMQPQPFIGKYKKISNDNWNYNRPTYETIEGVFETDEISFNARPNQIIFKDIEYQFNAR